VALDVAEKQPMLTFLKRLYRATLNLDHEARKVAEFLAREDAPSLGQCKVLEVGCGYGRHLRALNRLGFEMTGVDVNPEIVRANREAGLRCFVAEEFSQTNDSYDALLMSHVIEHFAPKDLIPFLDGYLDRLKVGGRLIIATPLLTRFFYDDFDHVKPYHPLGFLMVFGDGQAQVQYYSRNKLRLEDVWIRRGHWRFVHRRGRYMNSAATRLIQAVEFGSALAFRISGGLIGQADGWVGMFRKV
jgi:SAM-dependent methyltransferase